MMIMEYWNSDFQDHLTHNPIYFEGIIWHSRTFKFWKNWLHSQGLSSRCGQHEQRYS